ncbi:MAG TPA: Ig domain-containing protein [Ottowia sp.]|nr:Ig domain-containing protein [Ottowia sp.]HNJ45795.1 Ig domain-containing protein [Ottowia sp.]
MRKLIGIAALAGAALLAGCGGGGGSPGETHEQYRITLRAERTELPVNVANWGPGIGADAPYTTTLYVDATTGGLPIPNGEKDVFACKVAGGLGSGPLYYLDGKSEHETEVDDGQGGKVKVPTAYRSITLGSNAGGASFHFHAGNQVGTTRITCSVQDPRDKRDYSASVDITVGAGAGTGRPASVLATAKAPRYLGSQNNVSGIRNNVAIQAFVMDDANQPVANGAAANLQIRILPTPAAEGARLLGAQDGRMLHKATNGGVATFSLSSGPNRGVILLEMTVDRFDNNVSNGIQNPISQWVAVPVVHGISQKPLAFDRVTLDVTNGVMFAQALEAKDGTPPYVWQALDPLPRGLALSSTGVISGLSKARPGDYVVRVRVTDAFEDSVETPVTIKITAQPLVFQPPTIKLKLMERMSYALRAQGGTPDYRWSALGALPDGLTLSDDGILSGTPTKAGDYQVPIRVTDDAGMTDTQNVSISVTVDPLEFKAPSLDLELSRPFSYVLTAKGGVPPRTWSTLGTLPAGLSLSSDGVLSGTPTALGTTIVGIRVVDSTGAEVRDNMTIKVSVNALQFSAPSIALTRNLAFSYALTASGGVPGYTWSALGTLPAGINLSAAGVLSGTPTALGEFIVAVQVTDSAGNSVSDNVKITIEVAGGASPLTFSPPLFGLTANVGVAYAHQLLASGGVSPYTWAIISGTLPAGLSLNPSTGIIEGTPGAATAAPHSLVVRVTDDVGTSVTGNVSVSVSP